jgi:phosphoglycerate dehydrogenase-like enzyme
VSSPFIAVEPTPDASWLRPAVLRAGAALAERLADADALVWGRLSGKGLTEVLDQAPRVRWVQLATAGVDWLFNDGTFRGDITWTSAKGVYADSVAEAALLLALAGLRGMRHYVGAERWQPVAGARSLFGRNVVIIGGGGIATSLLRLLRPFNARVTVVRRSAEPIPGAAQVVSPDRLDEVLRDADLLVLAAPLTPATEGMISAQQFDRLPPDCWVVNVGRGRVLDHDALVQALAAGTIGGAALDVTDPEPLPTGDPLWTLTNCIITPHVAVTTEAAKEPLLAAVEANVRRFCTGQRLEGMVSGDYGY